MDAVKKKQSDTRRAVQPEYAYSEKDIATPGISVFGLDLSIYGLQFGGTDRISA